MALRFTRLTFIELPEKTDGSSSITINLRRQTPTIVFEATSSQGAHDRRINLRIGFPKWIASWIRLSQMTDDSTGTRFQPTHESAHLQDGQPA
ncbi:hypothetical protein N9L06_00660 [Mariniblastus sp.]|nr:hypothetical protein [Mariniblastus sp.]